jgi:hypothetical protein
MIDYASNSTKKFDTIYSDAAEEWLFKEEGEDNLLNFLRRLGMDKKVNVGYLRKEAIKWKKVGGRLWSGVYSRDSYGKDIEIEEDDYE